MRAVAISCLLAAFSAVTGVLGAPQPKNPWVYEHMHPHGNKGKGRGKSSVNRRSDSSGAATYNPITAPQSNLFWGLSDTDAAAVTSFLHNQAELNLTAAENATSWDNIIVVVELLHPNKTDAVPYLEGTGSAPSRYAKATIKFRATEEPYMQEFMVGPLPVTNGVTKYSPLNYIYNKGVGKQRIYDADDDAVQAYLYKVSGSIEDILLDLLNGTASGYANDTMIHNGIDPLWHENGSIVAWYQYWNIPTGAFDDISLLPTPLSFKMNVTGRNPDGWGVLGWYYNGVFYDTIEEFRAAWKSPGFVKVGLNPDGDFGDTDWNGEELAYDTVPPPMPISPGTGRYGVDTEAKYVEWMDFSFYLSFTRDTGVGLYNIKYRGERIIYELSLQEALAHYASYNPANSGTSYLDSYYGFGPFTFELVSGFDCPTYSTFLNSSFYVEETTQIHPNSICLFEFQKDYPIQRHSSSTYVSVSKNIMFVVRSVATVGNYDYQFSYEFYLDGSIQVVLRASGYIQSAYWAYNSDYGFKIQENLSGSMHDHVLNFKLDLDVKGTKNTLSKVEFAPSTELYPWSAGIPRNTMKIKKTFITNENDGKINWSDNSVATYAVVNKDQPNANGEYPGWKIVPTTGSSIHSTIQNSTNLGKSMSFATHHLYALKQKDTEPRSSYAYNSLDPNEPVVDFAKYFDGESLEQEDLVLYFNLGMHHLPDTSDLPNTVFTTAQSGITIKPQNYFSLDRSRSSRQQVKIDYTSTPAKVERFGATAASGSYDLSQSNPDLSGYIGDVVVRKFPYDPDDWWYGNGRDRDAVRRP